MHITSCTGVDPTEGDIFNFVSEYSLQYKQVAELSNTEAVFGGAAWRALKSLLWRSLREVKVSPRVGSLGPGASV